MKLALLTLNVTGKIISFCGQAIATMQSEYNVNVIEDDDVALAPKIPVNQLFPYALAAILVIAIILIIAVYIMECQKYRVRIIRLQSNNKDQIEKDRKSWNLKKLKIQAKKLEEETVKRMFG